MTARPIALLCLLAAACSPAPAPSCPPPSAPVVIADLSLPPVSDGTFDRIQSPDPENEAAKRSSGSAAILGGSGLASLSDDGFNAADMLRPVRTEEPAGAKSSRRRGKARSGGPGMPTTGSMANHVAQQPNPGAAAPASLSIGTTVQRNLTNDEILAVAEASMGMIRGCYERQLKSSPTLKGRMVVSWRINGDGSVSKPRADEDALGSDALQSCVLDVVAGWSFRASGASTRVAFPFFLKPGRL